MKVTEKPIKPGTLKSVRQLKGGNKGVLFVLENTADEKLVVKFQNEHTVEAIVGTQIMQKAGAATPAVRVASSTIEVPIVSLAVQRLSAQFPEVLAAFQAAKEKFKHVLFMDFAEGKTIKDVRRKDLDEFLEVISDEDFQKELGKIVAADTFAGNPDRMHSVKDFEKTSGARGWYHEQNLFLKDGPAGARPVAIDNAFQPRVMPSTLPWGQYAGGCAQWGSVASACRAYSTVEAGALFDEFIRTAKNNHPDEVDEIEDVADDERDDFVENFTDGATSAMQALLKRGQNWNGVLKAGGADTELLEQFRIRKRLLRQVAAGVDPQVANQRARNTDAYRKWVLTQEYKLDDDKADELLKQGVMGYKQFKTARLAGKPAPVGAGR